jgi:hypothetical protein
MNIIRTEQAEEIPEHWDHIAENIFQKAPFLLHCQKYNPCGQRYYMLYHDGMLKAGAVVYSLTLNILTFAGMKSNVAVNIAGVPASVSAPGIFGSRMEVEALKNHICSHEKGFTLFLNLTEKPQKGVRALGSTLPTIILENQYDEWDNYLNALRAPYRRRLRQIIQTEQTLELKRLSCLEFTEELHQLYLQVFNRSNDKLEKLTLDFFRKLPPAFELTVCYFNSKPLGWNISIYENDTFYFFMGGVDYELNKTHNTYFNLLINLIKDAIEQKAKTIDLGQTAEIPKLRSGGKIHKRYMEAYHTNKLINRLLKIISPLLSYQKKIKQPAVFKEPASTFKSNIPRKNFNRSAQVKSFN